MSWLFTAHITGAGRSLTNFGIEGRQSVSR
jgi:hypothetical protein